MVIPLARHANLAYRSVIANIFLAFACLTDNTFSLLHSSAAPVDALVLVAIDTS